MTSAPQHQCMIYRGSPTEHLGGLVTLAKERLRTNWRCLYLNNPSMVAEMRSCLIAAGVPVAEEVRRGALVLSSDQSHLENGRFEAVRMLGQLSDAVNDAVRDGFAGLWEHSAVGRATQVASCRRLTPYTQTCRSLPRNSAAKACA